MSRLQQGERFIEWLLAAARLHPAPPVDARLDPTLIALSANLQVRSLIHAIFVLTLTRGGVVVALGIAEM